MIKKEIIIYYVIWLMRKLNMKKWTENSHLLRKL